VPLDPNECARDAAEAVAILDDYNGTRVFIAQHMHVVSVEDAVRALLVGSWPELVRPARRGSG
jgi:hypothetical protein